MNNRIALVLTLGAGLLVAACNNSTSTNTNKKDTTAKDTSATPNQPGANEEVHMHGTTGKLLGVWYDESIKTEQGEKIAYQVIASNNKVYIQVISFAGTKLQVSDEPVVLPSASELKKDTEGYVSVERPTERYVVDKKGNLLIYDQKELVVTCKKIM